MPIFYSPDFNENSYEIVLSDNEYKHIKNTLRKSIGDTIEVTNGKRMLAVCEIKNIQNREIILQINQTTYKEKSYPQIALAFALLKQHNDLIIEKCTELGVFEFYPFYAKRNVKVSLSDHQLERLRKITVSAIKQCDSTHLPFIHEPVTYEKLLNSVTNQYTPILAWEEEQKTSLVSVLDTTFKDICLIVGPEGGFEEREISLAKKYNTQIVSLGNHILRAETAAIAFTAQTMFYQLGKNPAFY